MAVRPKYLVKALTDPTTSLSQKAEALARYHAPSARFEAVLSPKDSCFIGKSDALPLKRKKAKSKTEKKVRWHVTEGLTVLMHEIGHHACRHVNDDPCCTGYTVLEEAEAWLWAEKWAHIHGINFDYVLANKKFDKYHSEGVLVRWNYYNGAGPPCWCDHSGTHCPKHDTGGKP